MLVNECKQVKKWSWLLKYVVFARLGAVYREYLGFSSPCVYGTNTRFCRKTGYVANTRHFTLLFTQIWLRQMRFNSDLTQISVSKNGGWSLWGGVVGHFPPPMKFFKKMPWLSFGHKNILRGVPRVVFDFAYYPPTLQCLDRKLGRLTSVSYLTSEKDNDVLF